MWNQAKHWMARNRRATVVAALLSLLMVYVARSKMGASVEEPTYDVVSRVGQVEIRQYEPYTLAQTPVDGGFKSGLNRGFRRLAKFIFGRNTQAESIAMTAPVGRVETPEATLVTFAMPPGRSHKTLPAPYDSRVELVDLPARRVAALRFSGWASEAQTRRKMNELRDRLKAMHLEAAGPAMLAQYNPPWHLPFFRRNEVLIPVEG